MLNTKLKTMIGVLIILVLSAPLYTQTIIRVNCGGDEYWDSGGDQWYADQPYIEGSWGYENPGYFLFYDYPISGTNDDPLYQYEHNALDNYKFTVPNGTYIVTLKFAELYYDNVGDRVFHVEIEGDRVLSNFDIIAEVGFAAACDKTFQLDVSDGILDIQFITIEVAPGVTLAHANIKAISVVEQGTHAPKLWVNPHEIDFYDYSYRQYFEIKNGGELPLEWSCFEDPDETWITEVTPTSGSLYKGQSQRIEVHVSRDDLEDGQYQGNISITSNGGNDSVKVLMEVVSQVPILQVQPRTLGYGAILTRRIVNISNVGTAALNWTAEIQDNDLWIKKISPASGQIEPGEYQQAEVIVDRDGLTDSTYQGVIAVESNGGDEEIEISVATYNKPLTINCGGSQYLDNEQYNWSYDLGFVGGHTTQTEKNIDNTENDPLYQNTRAGMSKYQFDVQKNGYYQISLHFVEFQCDAAGQRIFDVQIEDSLVLTGFDIYAENGSHFAVTKSAQIEVKDHQLDISFIQKAGETCIAAIEIHQVPLLKIESTDLNFASILTKRSFTVNNFGTLALNWSAKNLNNEPWLIEISPTSGILAAYDSQMVTITIDRTNLTDSLYQGIVAVETDGGNQNIALAFETNNKPLRINCGGDDFVDHNEYTWLNDMQFIGGNSISRSDSIANAVDDQLYQSNRSGMTGYQFSVQDNGLYKITLHFAEIEHSSTGQRIFDIQFEDRLILKDFDIYKESGDHSANVKTGFIEITDQQLDISFIPKVGEPCIAAIEIFHSPILAVEPIAMKFGSILTGRTFSVINASNVELNWSAKSKANEPWLKEISPDYGIVAPIDTQLVSVTIDRAELTDSTYQGSITVETDGGDKTVSFTFETKNKPLRINCAGSEYIDTKEYRWFEDILFTGGSKKSYHDSIANTSDDQLYQTVRCGITSYQFPAQDNGLYQIALHFVEFEHTAPGQRIFDVQIEDSLVLENFDIFNESGSFTALIKSANTWVSDNKVDISFLSKVGEPCICAIEVFNSPVLTLEPITLNFGSILTKRTFSFSNAGTVNLNWSATDQNNELWLKEITPIAGVLAPADTQLITVTIDRQELADSMIFQGNIAVETDGGNQNIPLVFETTNAPLRINCGGAEYLDSNDNSWLDDILFNGGKSSNCQDSIANTEDDRLYQTARTGMTSYQLSIQDNGRYEIILHFVEFQHHEAGKRIFDVQIEDSLVLENFDIYAEYGSRYAGTKEIDIKVDDNQLDIVFLAKTGEPSIAGIEVSLKPELPTDIAQTDEPRSIPDRFLLDQNYPNPFNMETSISYQLPMTAHVTLAVYNLLGQKQKTLVNKEMSAGFHSIKWDGRDMNGIPVTSGLYIYQIQITPKEGQSMSFQQVRKMLLLK